MIAREALERIQAELREGMGLVKCSKCGCMEETLKELRAGLPSVRAAEAGELLRLVHEWQQQMKPIQYACLGCEYCYPAVAMNQLQQVLPEAAPAHTLPCAFEPKEQTWPVVPGEYFVLCEGPGGPVAVSTLASVELAERLAAARPPGLCIVGKTETENIGVDKIVRNTITNPTIRALLVAGKDPKGHQSGQTLLALWANGVDERHRVIGSPGKQPVLRNVTREEVEAFRRQVQVVDLLGSEDIERIVDTIRELAHRAKHVEPHVEECAPALAVAVPVLQAQESSGVEMDRAGYFVILPQSARGLIVVEQYSYDNRLLHVIEGRNARSISSTIIENGWVTQLSHAAYLGKELARAELSLQLAFKYVQDGASRAETEPPGAQ